MRESQPVAATLSLDAAASRCWDVIVIGAGPAGAMAARLLARAGRSVLLVERKTLPRHKPCGGCLNARAVGLLARAGLDDSVRQSGARDIDAIELHHHHRVVRLALPPGLALTRWTLDALLARAAIAAGAAFLCETTATVMRADEAHEAGTRGVRLQGPQAQPASVTGRVVLAADGLAHASLRDCPEFTSRVRHASRVGVSAVVDRSVLQAEDGAIRMVIGAHGYAGVAAAEAGHVNVAAALDPGLLRQAGGPASSVAALLTSAGIPLQSAAFAAFPWQGTLPLTRCTPRPVGWRLFVLGDAAGYVEPFTGEGMAMAFAAAHAVVPFALRAMSGWSAALEQEWLSVHFATVKREQRWCRGLAQLVRHPALTTAAFLALKRRPGLARPLLAHLGSPVTVT
jgi:menaquinone-9 beta-reductase